jgi:hypothetical protein
MPWVLIAVLLLIAVGEAAYIATPLLRARGLFGRPAVARLVVQAQSNGVDVTIDGQRRGQTPLNIELTPGPHVLELRANESERTPAPAPAPAPAPVAAVPPPTPAPVVPAVQTPPPAPSIGWLVVQSPLTLSVLRNGELIGNSDEGRLKLAPGHHEVELSNSAAGYREATTIQVIAGRETVLHPDLPQSTIDIQATPSAKIFIDGREVGDTPLLQLALTIGSHDILFRHPDFGDRHVTTFIRVGTPARASVDFSTQ